MNDIGLSARIRANSEAAPWVVEAVKELENELATAQKRIWQLEEEAMMSDRFIASIPKPGQWCVVDGFHLVEGPQRWKYLQVLSIYDTEAVADANTPEPLELPTEDGGPFLLDLGDDANRMKVGPVKRGDWFHEFDGKLWCPILDPDGYTIERTSFSIPGRQV